MMAVRLAMPLKMQSARWRGVIEGLEAAKRSFYRGGSRRGNSATFLSPRCAREEDARICASRRELRRRRAPRLYHSRARREGRRQAASAITIIG